MKHLTIPYLPGWPDADLAAISALMGELQFNDIAYQPWKRHFTTARFCIAHTGEILLIKYYVDEKHLSATLRPANDDVHKDTA